MERTIRCENCGTQNEEDDLFCAECGYKLSVSNSKVPYTPITRTQNQQKDTHSKKNGLIFLIVIILALVGIVTAYFLTKDTSKELDYRISNGEVTITRCKRSDTKKELVIPAYIEGGYPVTTIAERAFSECRNLTRITLPDSVTYIEDCAFIGCVSLTHINLPGSVTYIGASAFAGCDSLTSITLPDSVTYIGNYAFTGCNSQISITIPGSVTYIGEGAFQLCENLTSVNILNGVIHIGKNAFSQCYNLTSIIIPDSVISIGKNAFFSCYNLTRIYVEEGSYAHQWCLDNGYGDKVQFY